MLTLLCLKGRSMKTVYRYLVLITLCVAFSLAVTFATYFYYYVDDFGYGWVWSVNKGLPLSWAVETHYHGLTGPEPAFYPFDFQALNFSFDIVFWTTLLLLPSSLYLYLRRRTKAERLSTISARQP